MGKEKPKVKLNSPADTPDSEKIFVLEYTSTERIKVRKVDLENEILQLQDEVSKKTNRKLEVENLLKEINKL